jgi:hypothetical protein
MPAATLQDDTIASYEDHEIRQPFDQRIRGHGRVCHSGILGTHAGPVLDARHGCRDLPIRTSLNCSDFRGRRR